MRRITISVEDRLADTFDRLVNDNGYGNRSEAFRNLLRGALGQDRLEERTAKYCVGALSYVYNHHERQLASRLMAMQHEHHDLAVSAMHAHLDHDNYIETAILRGPTAAVVDFAQASGLMGRRPANGRPSGSPESLPKSRLSHDVSMVGVSGLQWTTTSGLMGNGI